MDPFTSAQDFWIVTLAKHLVISASNATKEDEMVKNEPSEYLYDS